jgi:hypothetical protein
MTRKEPASAVREQKRMRIAALLGIGEPPDWLDGPFVDYLDDLAKRKGVQAALEYLCKLIQRPNRFDRQHQRPARPIWK